MKVVIFKFKTKVIKLEQVTIRSPQRCAEYLQLQTNKDILKYELLWLRKVVTVAKINHYSAWIEHYSVVVNSASNTPNYLTAIKPGHFYMVQFYAIEMHLKWTLVMLPSNRKQERTLLFSMEVVGGPIKKKKKKPQTCQKSNMTNLQKIKGQTKEKTL